MNGFQTNMRDKLFNLEKKYGLKATIQIAKKSLIMGTKGCTEEFKTRFNGEVCEAVLELLINDWMKRANINGVMTRSLILKDLNSRNENFLTEIDLVLFTPWCVYCIECKSYAGEKRLLGDGKLYSSNGRAFDVFKQNAIHLDVLRGWIDGFSNNPKYQMLLFNFSNGNIRDERSTKSKDVMPLINEENLFRYIVRENSKVWDMEGIIRAIPKLEKFSDDHREKHLAYVKSLHSKE